MKVEKRISGQWLTAIEKALFVRWTFAESS